MSFLELHVTARMRSGHQRLSIDVLSPHWQVAGMGGHLHSLQLTVFAGSLPGPCPKKYLQLSFWGRGMTRRVCWNRGRTGTFYVCEGEVLAH